MPTTDERIAALEREIAELRDAISRLIHGPIDTPIDEPVIKFSADGWSEEHDPVSGGAWSKRIYELRQRQIAQANNPAVPQAVRKVSRELAEHRYLTGPIVADFSQDRWQALRELDVDAYVDARNSYAYHTHLQRRAGGGGLDVLPENGVYFPPVVDFYNPQGRHSYEGSMVIPNCDGTTDDAAYQRVLAFVDAVHTHGWHDGPSEDWA